MKPVLNKLIDRPHTRADTFTWIILYILIVGLMGFLSAIVDRVYQGSSESIDPSIVVGSATAFATAVLFGSLLFYNVQLRKALTRERAIDASRKRSEKRYRKLFSESLDMVSIVSPQGDLIDVNPAGAELLGYASEAELAELNLERDLVVSREAIGRLFNELESHGSVNDYELQLRHRDGREVTVTVNAGAILDADGNTESIHCLMRDVTDKVYLERQVMKAQRMESIGRVARAIAHRFSNVITAIQGYAELVAAEVPADGKAAAALKEIVDASERAEKLTRELMVFSRQHQLRPRPLDINRLVESSRDMMEDIIGDRIALSIEAEASPAIVDVDSVGIENMMLNMVMYSRERLRGQGEIRIATGNATIGDDYVCLHPEASRGEFIRLVLEDNGPVIPQDKINKVFEPAVSSRDGGPVTEMSVVHAMILHHEGWIDIMSSPDVTRFTVYLPASLAPAEQVDAAAGTDDDLRGSGQRLLIVEDEEPVRVMAEKILTRNGYEVFSAENASEAFLIYAREKGDIDAVFTDIIMPGESGIVLADHLSGYNARMPIILTSGHETTSDEWRLIEENGYHYLPKPYRMNDLLREISRVFSSN